MMTCVLIREDGERGRKIAEQRRRPREDGAESGVLLLGARTPQEDGGGQEGFSLRDFAGAGVCCQHPNFRLLPSRSLRKNISLALSHLTCGTLLGKPEETNFSFPTPNVRVVIGRKL